MIRYFLLGFFLMASLVVVGFGFRGHKFEEPPFELFPDMDRQPKVGFQESSDFFADGVATRRPVQGTIPMGFDVPEAAAADGGKPGRFGFSISNGYYDTGRMGDYFGDGMPEGLEVDEALMRRGKQRYNIHCAVCHGLAGNGKGVASKYGIAAAANFQLPDFSDPANPAYRPDGSFFHTITNGKGIMGGYGANVTVSDRWAIIAYIRALQAAVSEPATPSAPSAPAEQPAPAVEGSAGGEPAAGESEAKSGGDA